MKDGNKLWITSMRWAWDKVKAGEPDAVHYLGKTAREVMEGCIRVAEEKIEEDEAAAAVREGE